MERNNLRGLLAVLAGVALLSGCQSGGSGDQLAEATQPNAQATGQAETRAEEGEPRIAHLPGASQCEGLDKSKIEAVYTGRWLGYDGKPGMPHTLIVLKPEGAENRIYYAGDKWPAWRIHKPFCNLEPVTRAGNSIHGSARGGTATVKYQLAGESATGKFVGKRGTSPITMQRVWAAGES